MENRQIKERPILFSGEMVSAILDGRKTQTRRIVKELVSISQKDAQGNVHLHDPMILRDGCWLKPNEWSPYGRPGDRLWVRETWLPDPPADGTWDDVVFMGCENSPLSMIPDKYQKPIHCLYKCSWNGQQLKWKPSIFMPRWASRILLEVVSVRVERVQDISENDAIAEGIQRINNQDHWAWKDYTGNGQELSPRMSYESLWNSINEKKYPWESNPWVWVIEFRKVEA